MPGKFAKACQDCGKAGPTRFRTLQDRYLCESCYRKPSMMGVSASSPQAVGTGQTGKTVTIRGAATPTRDNPPDTADFDLRHLQ